MVSPGGIVTTGASGSYSFTGVAAGTYQVQITPSARLDVGTLSPGSAGGTAGANEIQLTLTAGQTATDYNFAILGANPELRFRAGGSGDDRVAGQLPDQVGAEVTHRPNQRRRRYDLFHELYGRRDAG